MNTSLIIDIVGLSLIGIYAIHTFYNIYKNKQYMSTRFKLYLYRVPFILMILLFVFIVDDIFSSYLNGDLSLNNVLHIKPNNVIYYELFSFSALLTLMALFYEATIFLDDV